MADKDNDNHGTRFQVGDEESVGSKVTKTEFNEANRSIREDFIAIFGIFATLFIFLSIEIQILKQATRFSLLVGFSLFLLAALLTFMMALHSIVQDKMTWKSYYANPVLGIVAVCGVSAAFCFLWATVLKPLS